MCKGISILASHVPVELIERHKLQERMTCRGSEQEIQFIYGSGALLPVEQDGRLSIYEWGNMNRQSKFPHTGWCNIESLEAGKWRWLEPEAVQIPAVFAIERGIWYQITQGIQGVLVYDEWERPHVYMLMKPATRYYNVMTRSTRMPVLIEQEI